MFGDNWMELDDKLLNQWIEKVENSNCLQLQSRRRHE
jgi:predicted phosphohydrolase